MKLNRWLKHDDFCFEQMYNGGHESKPCICGLASALAEKDTSEAHATCPECAGPEVTKIFCCEGGLELHPTCKAPASDEVYKKALERISQMSMSKYLSVNDLAKDAIRTAQEALGGH